VIFLKKIIITSLLSIVIFTVFSAALYVSLKKTLDENESKTITFVITNQTGNYMT